MATRARADIGGRFTLPENVSAPTLKYLSALRENHPDPGVPWTVLDGSTAALRHVADSLETAVAEVDADRFKSIPSPWARALLFEHALFDTAHPAHRSVLAEWRGLLGAIALSDLLPYKLTAKSVDLARANSDRTVLADLRRLSSPEGAWDKVLLLYVNDCLIGATSPLTLVFSSIRSLDNAPIPFLMHREEHASRASRRVRRLSDPAGFYAERKDRVTLSLLGGWVSMLIEEIERNSAAVNALGGAIDVNVAATRGGQLSQLLKDWRDDIGQHLNHPAGYAPSAAETVAGPLDILATGRLEYLKCLRAAKRPSETEFLCDLALDGIVGARIVDPGLTGEVIDRGGELYEGPLVLGLGNSTLVSGGRLPTSVVARDIGATLTPIEQLFEDYLIPLVGGSAHALTLSQKEGLSGQSFLFPFKKAIVTELGITPEQIKSWTRIEGDSARGYTVSFVVPVGEQRFVRWRASFPRDKVIPRANAPLIACWPDFEHEDWTHNFFVIRQRADVDVLDVGPATEAEIAASRDGSTRWGKSQRPVRVWEARSAGARGLLLSARRAGVLESGGTPWEVSIDLGSTHTRVFRKRADGGIAPVQIRPRSISLVGGSGELPLVFFPSAENAVELGDELRSLVRLPGGDRASVGDNQKDGAAAKWTPADGIIYWQSLLDVPNLDGVHPNLKWHNTPTDRNAMQAYVSQLAISTMAEAFAAGSPITHVSTAYPSVFPRSLRARHDEVWTAIAGGLSLELGSRRAESAAVADYLVHARGAKPADNLLAIDIGGSTSDLAIWADGHAVALDSVKLAGDVITRLVRTNADVRRLIGRAAENVLGASAKDPWRESEALNGLVFTALVRATARRDEERNKKPAGSGDSTALARALYEDPESLGAWVIAHMGYTYALVSYLMGLMVRRHKLKHAHFDLYFAGHGSQFLPWLDELADGASSRIPSHFFAAGLARSGKPAGVTVHMPHEMAKQEVGRGLLTPQSAGDLPETRERVTFVGETGVQSKDGDSLEWTEPLSTLQLRRLKAPSGGRQAAAQELISSFADAFEGCPEAQAIRRALRVSAICFDAECQSRATEYMYGAASAFTLANRTATPDEKNDTAILEPFVVPEAKAMLEVITKNPQLFRDL